MPPNGLEGGSGRASFGQQAGISDTRSIYGRSLPRYRPINGSCCFDDTTPRLWQITASFTLYAENILVQIISHFASDFQSKTFKPFPLLALLTLFSFGHMARAAPSPYDGNMRNNCSPSGVCDSQSVDKIFVTPGVTLPTHGFVWITGSFISPVGEWTIVDFDHDTVTSILTSFDRLTRTTTVMKKISVKVAAKATVAVSELAADLWNSKTSSTPSAGFCLDVAQEFILFDGSRTVWYRGACPPNGIAGNMNRWAEKQLRSSTKP